MTILKDLLALKQEPLDESVSKSLSDILDRKANGADDVEHEGKSYEREGPADPTKKPGPWKEVKRHVNEARKRGDMYQAVDKWMDRNKAYSWEGSRGIRNLTRLVSDMDYRSLDAFFEDNPGALEAVVSWIQSQNSPEWLQSLGMGEDEDDDDR